MGIQNVIRNEIVEQVARNISRMRYLSMAATCIKEGSQPIGPDLDNCVGYLLDTIDYLGRIAEDMADQLEGKH